MKLDKETAGMALGALIGSLVEEVAEQVFPGVGDMGILGESLGLLGGAAATRESVATKQAVAQLLKFTYKQLGGDDDIESLDQETLEDFFRSKPSGERIRVLNKFKAIDPVSFQYVNSQLKD